MPNVDVISDGENIKKLLKLPFSNSSVSMIVHRVGKTLLIDDLDIHQYLLRRSATEWEWLRKYFTQTILHEIEEKEGAVVKRRNCSNAALQAEFHGSRVIDGIRLDRIRIQFCIMAVSS